MPETGLVLGDSDRRLVMEAELGEASLALLETLNERKSQVARDQDFVLAARLREAERVLQGRLKVNSTFLTHGFSVSARFCEWEFAPNNKIYVYVVVVARKVGDEIVVTEIGMPTERDLDSFLDGLRILAPPGSVPTKARTMSITSQLQLTGAPQK